MANLCCLLVHTLRTTLSELSDNLFEAADVPDCGSRRQCFGRLWEVVGSENYE